MYVQARRNVNVEMYYLTHKTINTFNDLYSLLVRNVNLVCETDGLGKGDASPLLHEEVHYPSDFIGVRPRARKQRREGEPHAGAAFGSLNRR